LDGGVNVPAALNVPEEEDTGADQRGCRQHHGQHEH
jgi:hypothetical protein